MRVGSLERLFVVALFALAAALGSGCSEATETAPVTALPNTTNPNPTNPTTPTTPTNPDEPKINLLGGLYFQLPQGDDGQPCVNNCALHLAAGTPRPLGVLLKDATGNPITEVALSYKLSGNTQVATLSSTNTTTDLLGMATVQLNPTGAEGDVSIQVSVPGSPLIDPVTFQASLSTEQVPELEVNFNYTGTLTDPIMGVKVYGPTATGPAPTCAEVHPDSATPAPAATQEAGPFVFNQTATFQTLPQPVNNQASVWTIQVLAPYGETPSARGCMEGIETTPGQTRAITVQVADIPMRYAGVYDVTTRMDLINGLEGTAASGVALLLDLFTEPGVVVIKAVCTNASGTMGTEGPIGG